MSDASFAADAAPASKSAADPNAAKTAPGSATRWRLAFLFAALSFASGVLLTGVSTWFLGAVALAGAGTAAFAFDFHTPGALVRLFAIARTGARYGERLSGHAAALTDQVTRRLALFTAMALAPETRGASWQLSRDDRLADWIEDVEHQDNERLRVHFPAVTLAGGVLALLAATVYVVPVAVPPITLTGIGVLLVMRRSKDRAATIEADQRRALRNGSAALGAALQSLVSLAAEGRRLDRFASALDGFSEADGLAKRQITVLAPIDLAVSAFGPIAVVSVLVAASTAGARSEDLLPAAFVAFGWLAIGEAGSGLSRIIAGRVKADAARRSHAVRTVDDSADRVARRTSLRPVEMIQVNALRLATLDGRPVGRPVTHMFRRGHPTAVTGVSGSGKTTLLKTIAGWLDPAEGTVLVDGVPCGSADRCARVHIGLHDAAVLSDTIRANLFADTASEAEVMSALAEVEMVDRVLEAGGLDAWITHDVLSLGEAQRLNLARAFLTTAPVIALDEPTEHLDPKQGLRILGRLRHRLADRIFIYTAHQAPLLGDETLCL